MAKLKNFTKKLTKFIISLPKRDLSILLPSLYIMLLLLGFLLTVLFYAFPSLVSCSKFLGREFCTPTGVYISFMVSVPGYFVVGNIIGDYINKIPIAISFFFVVGVSILVYFFLGIFLQKVKNGEIFKKEATSKLVFFTFIVLLTILILLVI